MLIQLFDVLRSQRPTSFDKVIPIFGNIATENLGLLPADREILIDRVSMIFHIAASVRFDERSTRDICILAKNMKKLVVSIIIIYFA